MKAHAEEDMEQNIPPLLEGVQNCTATKDISVALPQIDQNQTTSRSTQSRAYTQRILQPTQGPLLNHDHCSFIHNSQKL